MEHLFMFVGHLHIFFLFETCLVKSFFSFNLGVFAVVVLFCFSIVELVSNSKHGLVTLFLI